MANGAAEAVRIATSVGEIGFPEFTAKLITDVFDALISANIRQQEMHIELVSQISKGLTEFINNTKDDISGDMVLDFLKMVLPESGGTSIKKTSTKALGDSAKVLNDAVAVVGEGNTNLQKVTFAPEDKINTKFDAILDAVAMRLSASKYECLKEMIKMGMLRLVIETGSIESRMTFNTYGHSYSSDVASQYSKSTSTSYSASGILGTIFNGPKVSRNSRVSISTATQKNYDSTGSSVQIFGKVLLNFKTDYMPLND